MNSYSGLIIDAAIISAILLCGVGGYRRGLFISLLGIFKWIIAIAFATLTYPYVKEFLMSHTQLQRNLASHIAVSTGLDFTKAPDLLNFLPSDLSKDIAMSGEDAVQMMAGTIAGAILSVISFMLVLLVFWLATVFITRAMTRRKSKGLIGGIDSLLGLLFGLLKGSLILCVVFLGLVPLMSFMGPEASKPFLDVIHNSILANALYYDNPLLIILK